MDKLKSEFEKIKPVNYVGPVRKRVINFCMKIFLNVLIWLYIYNRETNVMKCHVFILDNRSVTI